VFAQPCVSHERRPSAGKPEQASDRLYEGKPLLKRQKRQKDDWRRVPQGVGHGGVPHKGDCFNRSKAKEESCTRENCFNRSKAKEESRTRGDCRTRDKGEVAGKAKCNGSGN